MPFLLPQVPISPRLGEVSSAFKAGSHLRKARTPSPPSSPLFLARVLFPVRPSAPNTWRQSPRGVVGGFPVPVWDAADGPVPVPSCGHGPSMLGRRLLSEARAGVMGHLHLSQCILAVDSAADPRSHPLLSAVTKGPGAPASHPGSPGPRTAPPAVPSPHPAVPLPGPAFSLSCFWWPPDQPLIGSLCPRPLQPLRVALGLLCGLVLVPPDFLSTSVASKMKSGPHRRLLGPAQAWCCSLAFASLLTAPCSPTSALCGLWAWL